MSSGVDRKLTTILAADAEGYSRAMAADEERALGALRAARRVFSASIEHHRGRIANTAGDGLIAEFPSAVEAVQCAIEVQRALGDLQRSQDGALCFRIGVHLGDVIVDGRDLLGDGVNLAARLQAMAEPGGILISQQVYDQVHNKLSVGFEYLGEKRPRNLAADVPVYRIAVGGERYRVAHGRHRARSPAPAAAAGDDRAVLRDGVARRAKRLAVIGLVILAIDLATGGDIWAHWPGLALATLAAWDAAPLVARGWFTRQYARLAVIVGALAVVNLVTWSGYPWVLWPAGALFVIELIRRLGVRAH